MCTCYLAAPIELCKVCAGHAEELEGVEAQGGDSAGWDGVLDARVDPETLAARVWHGRSPAGGIQEGWAVGRVNDGCLPVSEDDPVCVGVGGTRGGFPEERRILRLPQLILILGVDLAEDK